MTTPSTTTTVCITVKYFASIREAIGQGSERVDTLARTVAELRDALVARGGPYAEVLARSRPVRAAVNQVLGGEQVPLQDGTEVAFFPPVTGG